MTSISTGGEHPVPGFADLDDATAVTLRQGGRPVARYVWRPDVPVALAPRPYLHPVRTLSGTAVTDLMPPSHRHHLGASLAIADIDGHNFWGGRTFVPDHGPAWLDNQGTQQHEDWLRRTPEELSHALRWVTVDGDVLLRERRTLACRPVAGGAWALDVSFELANPADRPLAIRSPAAYGRAGAGYGGFFWRAPAATRHARAFGPAGDRLDALHGARAEWLALTGTGEDPREGFPPDDEGRTRQWTLVFVGGTDLTRRDPWFVRTRDYVGVGSSLAWERPLVLAPGAVLARRVVTVVADGPLPPEHAAALAAAARPAS